jgi:hypothetical protein
MKVLLILLIVSLLVRFVADPFSINAADDFTEKMQSYFNIPIQYEMRYLDGGWWGATLAEGTPFSCTSTVYLSTFWEKDQRPLWKYVLVHEWVHTTQGANCVNNERATRLEAFRILYEAKEFMALVFSINHFLSIGEITMAETRGVIKGD